MPDSRTHQRPRRTVEGRLLPCRMHQPCGSLHRRSHAQRGGDAEYPRCCEPTCFNARLIIVRFYLSNNLPCRRVKQLHLTAAYIAKKYALLVIYFVPSILEIAAPSHGVCPPVRLSCSYNSKTDASQADNLTDTTTKFLGGSENVVLTFTSIKL